MHYNTKAYLKLKEQRKHTLFLYSMLLALLLLLVNIVMDYLLTGHIPFNAVVAIVPVVLFLIVKHFFSFSLEVYRCFYLAFIIIVIQSIIYARAEHATTTYWAFLLIITIFTYESSIKSAVIFNVMAFLSLLSLTVLEHLSLIKLPYTQFNYLSFLMIYVVLSIFVYIMVKNFSEIESIIHRQSLLLQSNVDELHKMQQDLIDAEKMASLGGLVAGISHEINTPLGIALTAITHNQDRLIDTEKHLYGKTLKRSMLIESINSQQQGYEIILKNLDRANNLVGHFKQVAVDQASENLREIHVNEYIQEIVDSTYSLLKQKNILIHVDGPKNIKVNTYPGPIYQIISNLINNSVLHGFELKEDGNISIKVNVSQGRITINYLDDGVGMTEDMLQTIYDPFVTSKRNKGGSGLGMNIVYNIVTQVLDGDISCQSTLGEGVEIVVSFPVDVCTSTENNDIG